MTKIVSCFASMIVILLFVNNAYGQTVDSLQINKECEWFWSCPDSVFVEEVKRLGPAIDFSDPTPVHCIVVSRMATMFTHNGDYETSLRCAIAVNNRIAQIFGEQSDYYASNIHNILNTVFLSRDDDSVYSTFYNMMRLGTDYHDPTVAISRLGKDILSLYENDEGKTLIVNSTKIILGDTWSRQGDYQKALEYYDDVINSCISTSDERNICVAQMKKAYCCVQLGKYKESLLLTQDAVQKASPLFGDIELSYFWGDLAKIYFQFGEWGKARDLLNKIAITYEKNNYVDINYCEAILNLALLDFREGRYDECLIKAENAKITLDSSFVMNKLRYADFLIEFSYLQRETGNVELALKGFVEAAKIRKEKLGVTHHLYAEVLIELSKTYAKLGDNGTAKTLGIESMLVIKGIYGEKHSKSADVLSLLSEYSSDPNQIAFYFRDAFRIKRNVVLNDFATMTLSEQKRYWEEEKDLIAEQSINAAFRSRNSTSVETAYDAALLSKGLLLNSETEFREIINKSGNASAISTYNHLSVVNKTITEEERKGISNRILDVDSLKYVRDSIEQKLVFITSELGDYTKNLAVSWKDVKNSLTKDELAIEFVYYKGQYAALVLGEKYPHPKMLFLCTQEQIDSVAKGDYYTTDEMYKLLWKPLQPYISKASKIFFSPTADFHKIAIETIGNIFLPSKEFFRLTSTRQLVVKNKNSFNNNIVLYGGMDYNMSVDDMAESHTSYLDTETLTVMRSNGAGLKGVRFSNLPGTKVEVHNIDLLIKENKNYESTVFVGDQGTEESVHYISQKVQPRILHIATHGFYWTESNANELLATNKLSFLAGVDDDALLEDRAMTRSGLVFSGANNILRGYEVPTNVEDGVLTAQEISKLDLKSCDLVVLSACQTGLGDISTEGVFGLQRGFKKAGANSLLISLWEVDDVATQLLMTNFYRQLMNGESKSLSLRFAQNVVKNTQGYSDPMFWAGFVLVDAVEKKQMNEQVDDYSEAVVIRNAVLSDSIDVGNFRIRYSLDVDYPIGNDKLTSRIQDYILDILNPYSYDRRMKRKYAYRKDRNNLDLLAKHYMDLYFKSTIEDIKSDEVGDQDLTQEEMETWFEEFFVDYEIKVESNDDDLISYRTVIYDYIGGAHGMYSNTGQTFFKNGATPFNWDAFQDKTSIELASIIEQAIAVQYFKQSITDFRSEQSVYSPDRSKFPVPVCDPFVTKEGVFFKYEPYEISCYADGAPECVVPIALLLPFFKEKYISLLR